MSVGKLMAIGAHADDIELDVGGTLLKYHDRGYEVIYVMSTNNMSGKLRVLEVNGAISISTPAYSEVMVCRKAEALAGARVFGTTPIHLDFPQRHFWDADGTYHEVGFGSHCPSPTVAGMPTILTAHDHPSAVQRVKKLIIENDPEVILTHGHLGDNLEHIATCLLVTKAYRQALKEGYRGMLLYWHCIAATTFRDNYCRWDTHVDVSDVWQRKLDLVGLHASQKPNAATLDYPGWGAACGCRQAEVFSIGGEGDPPIYFSEFLIEIFRNRRS